MSKALPAPAMPMGISFDPDIQLTENAVAAWEAKKSQVRAQAERSASQLIRRVFRIEDVEFSYQSFAPETPCLVIDDEMVAYRSEDGCLALVELCGECGDDWQTRSFRDLAGFGRAIEMRDDALAFVCRDCQVEGATRKRRKR